MGKGGPAGLAMGGVMVASMVALALLLGVPEIFGISFGWGWEAVDRGRTTVHALTPKIMEVETRDIFLAEGEQLVAAYDLQLDAGRARMSVYTWGWVPVIGDLEWFHQNSSIRSSTRREVRVVAPRSGFYTVSGAIVDATGTFTIDWRVQDARRQGRAMRFIGSAKSWIGLLLTAVAGLAVGAVALRAIGRD